MGGGYGRKQIGQIKKRLAVTCDHYNLRSKRQDPWEENACHASISLCLDGSVQEFQ